MIVTKTIIKKGVGSIYSKTSQENARNEIKRFEEMSKEKNIQVDITVSEYDGKIKHLQIIW